MKLIRKMLYYSEKMYSEPRIGKVVKTDVNYTEVIVDEDNNIIIAFRGTDNLQGWIKNLNCYENIEKNQNIHDGFHDGFYEMRAELYATIMTVYLAIKYNQPHNKPKFFITGHSLGGALAILCTELIHRKYNGHDISCIVFGCPRVGNKKFRDRIEALPVRITRIVNGYDIVDKLPLRIMGFRHVGKSVKLPQPWWYWFLGRVRAHLTKNYWKGIDNYEKKNR